MKSKSRLSLKLVIVNPYKFPLLLTERSRKVSGIVHELFIINSPV